MADRLLQLEDFSGRVGETFRVVDGEETIEIELIEAVASVGKAFSRPPFSVVFRLPEEIAMQQRTFHIEHDDLGAMDLFLVPIGPGKTGIQCEAVFT